MRGCCCAPMPFRSEARPLSRAPACALPIMSRTITKRCNARQEPCAVPLQHERSEIELGAGTGRASRRVRGRSTTPRVPRTGAACVMPGVGRDFPAIATGLRTSPRWEETCQDVGVEEAARKAEDRVQVSGGVRGLDRIGELTPHFRGDGGARPLAETDKNEFRGKSKEIDLI
ncbi:hypothetical protein GY45DRAFT_504246 [Cubamyces sp. BRFM 1775]|nr:hypothetical protein GY45DRAFT_504246 [Cubamyces sp. BRFM 1775]